MAALIAAGAARGQTAADGGRLLWETAPTRADIEATLLSTTRGPRQFDLIDCTITTELKLEGCRTIEVAHEPAVTEQQRTAIREASLRLAALFRLSPQSAAAHPPGSRVSLDLRFGNGLSLIEDLKSYRPLKLEQLVSRPSTEDPQLVSGEGNPDALIVVDCRVGRLGVLSDCAVAHDTSGSASLRASAIGLAGAAKASAWFTGQPTEGRAIRIPVNFAQAGDGEQRGFAAPEPRAGDLAASDIAFRPAPGLDLARYYPDRAMRLQQSGLTEVNCGIAADGDLVACFTTREEPVGFGFGDAAERAFERHLQVEASTKSGERTPNRRVNLKMQWRLPDG